MTSRVVVALRVAVTPARAFEAFTAEIGRWWRPAGMFQFTRRGKGTLAFEPGPEGRLVERYASGEAFEIGRITAWEPGQRLAFTWRQESFAVGQVTEVEVRFEPVGEETRVTVEHRGWETVPAENVARHGMADAVFLKRHAEWWQIVLAAYRRRVVAAEAPADPLASSK